MGLGHVERAVIIQGLTRIVGPHSHSGMRVHPRLRIVGITAALERQSLPFASSATAILFIGGRLSLAFPRLSSRRVAAADTKRDAQGRQSGPAKKCHDRFPPVNGAWFKPG